MDLSALREPKPGLRAAVVVPARDEELLIASCMQALRDQRGLEAGSWEVLLVLDGCTDRTEEVAAATVDGGVPVQPIRAEGLGAGGARSLGMDIACRRLEATVGDEGLIATTDADSRVEPDWLARQLEASASGAAAIGGLITLSPEDSAILDPLTIAERESRHLHRLADVADDGPAEHPFFGGASIGITVAAYRAVGGMEALDSLEDDDLARRLRSSGIEIHRLDTVRVTTSARTVGRATRGLARDLQVSEWRRRRTHESTEFSPDRLSEVKARAVSLILPAKEVSATIGDIVEELLPLQDAGLVDELVVVDAPSADETAAIAARAGAKVVQEADLLPDFGPVRGKGDAMWRAGACAQGDIIVFCDADSRDFRRDFALGVLGPMLADHSVKLVKGAFERPFDTGSALLPREGGRVTELVARPLLNLHFPSLAAVQQPLAGEIAIDRELFGRMSIPVGYGVEIAMLIDALDLVGLDAIAQTHLGSRQNRHQPLRALSRMAYEVMVAAQRRVPGAAHVAPGSLLSPRGRFEPSDQPRCEERPAFGCLAARR